ITLSAIARTCRSEVPEATIMVSATSVSPRTSSTLMFTALRSSSALSTSFSSAISSLLRGTRWGRLVGAGELRDLGLDRDWGGRRAGLLPEAERSRREGGPRRVVVMRFGLPLLLSIAPRGENQVADRVGHQVAQVAIGVNQLAEVSGGYLKLRDRQHVHASGLALVQVANAAGAPIDHNLAQRAGDGRLPAGAMGNDHVSQVEDLAPAMPV